MTKQNIYFWIILSVALIAMLTDYLVYLIKLPYQVALIISVIICSITSIFLIKRKKIKLVFNWKHTDIFMISFLISFILMNISICDYSYDVGNYHIYLQENPFVDKVNFDFFAGKTLNAFLFPLGDRMHYIFRYLLGFRAGTILSYFTLLVIFYEAKKILCLIEENKHSKLVPIFAMFCTLSSYIIRIWSKTYYIDILAIPFLLEIIYTVLYCKKNKLDLSGNKVIYLCLLSGVLTGIKVSNIFLIVPILLYALFVLKLKLKIDKKFIIAIIAFFAPFIIYALDNVLQTGSPLFPYYNNIFKSKYFGFFSWKDYRFGIPNILFAIIWPIYTSLFCVWYGDDAIIYDSIFAIGYIATLLFMAYSFKKKKLKSIEFDIGMISLLITIFWIAFLEGYRRYALILPVCYSIVISNVAIFLIRRISNKYFIKEKFDSRFINKISYAFSAVILLVSIFSISDLAKDNYEMLFKDKVDTSSIIEIDGVWGTIDDDVWITELVRNKNTPIYNLDKSTIDTSEETLAMYYDRIKNNKIYVLMEDFYYESKLAQLEENGFEIVESVDTYTQEQLKFLEKYDFAELCVVQYVGNEDEL